MARNEFGTTPKEWRKIPERTGFRAPILLEASDYFIIGFGNSMTLISKVGHDPVDLPNHIDAEPVYPPVNGHRPKIENALEQQSIYQAPAGKKVGV
jgi:hypothetical protein